MNNHIKTYRNFYPRSPCGERLPAVPCRILRMLFLSTLSLRRATFGRIMSVSSGLFLSTLSLRRATRGKRKCPEQSKFLSTLSLRRATLGAGKSYHVRGISIHALLAESDILAVQLGCRSSLFLSTLSLRRATCFFCVKLLLRLIFLSTLSLRRATCFVKIMSALSGYFYPRSPCGERPLKKFPPMCTIKHFYPRSPCGERQYSKPTGQAQSFISIHALLAESDLDARQPCNVR